MYNNKTTLKTSNIYCLLSMYLVLPVQDSCYYFMYLIENCLKMSVHASRDEYHGTCVEVEGHLSYSVVEMALRPSAWQHMPLLTDPPHQPSCFTSRGSHTPAQWETAVQQVLSSLLKKTTTQLTSHCQGSSSGIWPMTAHIWSGDSTPAFVSRST